MKKNIFVTILIILFFVSISNATTWFPSTHICPVCSKANKYQDIGSYGSYIYNWPSKYQYIYWPLTDEPSIYCCVDCGFSCYMWDFDDLPEENIESIKSMLETVKFDKKYDDYLDVPIMTRLEIAENVYSLLDKDDSFWCDFYRICAYHSELGTTNEEQHFGGTTSKGDDADVDLAYEFRIKSKQLAFKMLNDSLNTGKEKENAYIVGAMYYFTNEVDSALFYMKIAKDYYYTNNEWEDDNITGFNTYLDELITDYIEIIEKKDDD